MSLVFSLVVVLKNSDAQLATARAKIVDDDASGRSADALYADAMAIYARKEALAVESKEVTKERTCDVV